MKKNKNKTSRKKVVGFIQPDLHDKIEQICRKNGITKLHIIEYAINTFSSEVGDDQKINITINRDHREGGPSAEARPQDATCNRGKFFFGGWVDKASHSIIKEMSRKYNVSISSILEWGVGHYIANSRENLN